MVERNLQIDILRGFAIILVIIGHVIAFSSSGEYNKNLLFNMIYSFHMPLFFMISGYLVFGRFNPNVLEWVKKKFKALVIPYIIFSLIYFFIMPGLPAMSHITIDRLIYVLFAFTVPDSAWFLPVLFESLMILAIIIVLEKAVGKTIVYPIFFLLFLVILPLAGASSIVVLNQIVYYSPYVVVGYCINFFKKTITKYTMPIMCIGFLIFPLLFSLRYNFLTRTPFNDLVCYAHGYLPHIVVIYLQQLSGLYYYYATALTGVVFSYCITKILSNYRVTDKIVSIFALCGIFSMEIYLTHLVVLFYSGYLRIPLWFGSGIVAVITGTMIVCSISLTLSLLLSYNKIISTILFGRWPIKYIPKINLYLINFNGSK